jgi:hypothetical protein
MSETRQQYSHSLQTLFKGNNSILTSLCGRADYLHQMSLKLCSYLPAPLNVHCKLANITDDTVIMHADSSAWAARLRYSIPEILNIMRNQLNTINIKSIRIKVMFPDKKSHTNTGRTLTISKQTARLLADCAKSTTDPALRSTLLRLSSHTD